MRRVLMVSPHFPPDSSAASHRLRLIGPYLADLGWSPTIVTVDPSGYESRLDPSLLAMVPDTLNVVRVRALSPRWTRKLGFGDLGMRAFPALFRACRDLSRQESFDCFFVTIFPSYPALLGPLVKRKVPLPYVLDYQDPWVGAWGLSTGPGPDAAPDLRSRLSRALATRLEPIAVRAADAITAVSEATYRDVLDRHPEAKNKHCAEIPIGGDASDFDYLRERPRANPFFDAGDGGFHLSYVGTLLPKGIETLRAVLSAIALLRKNQPGLFAKLHVRFFGTSNQSTGVCPERVMPEARKLGLEETVEEVPRRLDYLDALTVLTQSSGILLMGSSEKHYTASKLYPALLARRPILAAYHAESSVVSILQRAAPCPWARIVTYDVEHPAGARVDAMSSELASLLTETPEDACVIDFDVVEEFSARSMARRLAAVLDRASGSRVR